MSARLFLSSLLVLILMVASAAVSGAQGPRQQTAQRAQGPRQQTAQRAQGPRLQSAQRAQGPRLQSAQPISASVTTAFTYQGRLTEGNAPANGPHDFRFRLYAVEKDGNPVGNPVELADVPVDDGLVTVQLDFGNVFDGTAFWLEVSVRPSSSIGNYTVLSPRQPLTATPYALHSFRVWKLDGNADADIDSFLGTTEARPLIVKTNNAEALRVDSKGNVGVGTESPASKLDVTTLSSGAIGLMSTSTTRAIIGRLGVVPCPGTYGVGGCAGNSGGIGVVGASETGVGVHGESNSNRAVEGFSVTGVGVAGDSATRGVVGTLAHGVCAGTYAVGGCGGTAGVGVFGDSATRGVIGTLGGNACGGTYGIGGCGGKLGDGVVGHTDVGPNSITAAAVHAYNWGGGDIFIGEASGARKARIDGTGKGYFNNGVQTGGADYADAMPTTDNPADLAPGDVLAIDPQHGYAVRRSREPNSRLVAGVYSTQPSILGGGRHGIDDPLAGEVPVALVGVVPTKVSAENGPIQIGDLLVTSSLPGRAMKARPDVINGVLVYPTGAILGKALEPLQQGTGVIAVLVTLR